MKPLFFISAPVDTWSGYGARSRDIVKALIKSDKYDIKIIPQRWGATPFGFLQEDISLLAMTINDSCIVLVDGNLVC